MWSEVSVRFWGLTTDDGDANLRHARAGPVVQLVLHSGEPGDLDRASLRVERAIGDRDPCLGRPRRLTPVGRGSLRRPLSAGAWPA